MDGDEEIKRILTIPFEDSVDGLEKELAEVITRYGYKHITNLLKVNHTILQPTSYRPVLEKIHSKWREEIYNNKVLIEEIYLIYNNMTNTYRWKPEYKSQKNGEQIILHHNFTKTYVE